MKRDHSNVIMNHERVLLSFSQSELIRIEYEQSNKAELKEFGEQD
jgi:hypothetical protein